MEVEQWYYGSLTFCRSFVTMGFLAGYNCHMAAMTTKQTLDKDTKTVSKAFHCNSFKPHKEDYRAGNIYSHWLSRTPFMDYGMCCVWWYFRMTCYSVVRSLITLFNCTTIQFINNVRGSDIQCILSNLITYRCFTILPDFIFREMDLKCHMH